MVCLHKGQWMCWYFNQSLKVNFEDKVRHSLIRFWFRRVSSNSCPILFIHVTCTVNTPSTPKFRDPLS